MSNKDYNKEETVTELLDIEKEKHLRTKIKLASKERELHDITSSTAFKVAKILAKFKQIVLLPINLILTFHPRMRYRIYRNKSYVKKYYESELLNFKLTRDESTDTLVVLHLFYVEMLDNFCKKLESLKSIKYDLYITIPESKADYVENVKKSCPDAKVVIVPNCGRDVLPFIQVMKAVKSLGYRNVLKIHSKKSPHRVDGEIWRDKIIDSLIPKDENVLRKIIAILSKEDASIIGPQGEYVSLLVNYDSTDHHLRRIIKLLYGEKISRELKPKADEYGFFAGTMFWAKVDELWPVIDAVSMEHFEPELGQVDSTLAHAIERLFTLVPELNNKNIYEVSSKDVLEIDKHTSNIPEWSEVALMSSDK